MLLLKEKIKIMILSHAVCLKMILSDSLTEFGLTSECVDHNKALLQQEWKNRPPNSFIYWNLDIGL